MDLRGLSASNIPRALVKDRPMTANLKNQLCRLVQI